MASTDDRQKKLKAFLARRHPEYEGRLAHWEFVQGTYNGGREWFMSNIFRYIKEGEQEFKDRLNRAYRFNHSREVVDLLNKYLFKMEIARANDDAPDSVKRFWKEATLNRMPIAEFMKSVSTRASIFGRIWVVVDSTKNADVRTKAEEKAVDARTYAYVVNPMNALDMSYDDLGELNWILFREVVRADQDPIESSGAEQEQYRLWTREFWQLFTLEKRGNKVIVVEHEPVPHDLGQVPAIPVDNVITDELYASPGFIDDVAYLDRAVANYLSNMDAIIQDQTFSQLVMPAQGLLPGEDGYNKLVEMGTKRVFTYDGEHGGKPEYISPDVKQAELILKIINKIINEIYHSVGLAGERTKEDNSQGIDNSSGVAKAYDFERVNSLLASKADSLELAENRIARLVALWHSEEKVVDSRETSLVIYPDNFDVRGLYDEFDIAARLALIEAPDMMRREQMDLVRQKLFPQLKQDLIEKMRSELNSWPPQIDPMAEATGTGGQVISKSGRNSLANKLVKTK